MYDNIANIYLTRSKERFEDRNSKMPEADVLRFLNLHIANRPPYVKNDIFSDYAKKGMTRAEYFIETRMDQFNSILMFFMELQTHGIRNQTQDTFEGRVPYHVLHKSLQK